MSFAARSARPALPTCVALELQPFGVRAHLVLPGRSPETRFAENARSRMKGLDHDAYADLVKAFIARLSAPGPVTHAQDVAEAVWRVVNDPSSPIRILAGADAVAWAANES